MPLYEYRCSCGHTAEIYRHMWNEEPEICPKCLNYMGRIPSVPHTHRDFNKSIEHYALAPTDPEDVMELRKKLPSEIQMSIDQDDPMYGVPISRNETERKQILKAAGHVDKSRQ
jgi:putative FmdB family regulatory protein